MKTPHAETAKLSFELKAMRERLKKVSAERLDALASIETLSAKVHELTKERDEERGAKDRAIAAWAEEGKKSSQAMGAALEVGKLRKQLDIIRHIAAGRTGEAIVALLDPLVVAINMDVRMTDEAHESSQNQMLARLKQELVQHIGALEIKRETKKGRNDDSGTGK